MFSYYSCCPTLIKHQCTIITGCPAGNQALWSLRASVASASRACASENSQNTPVAMITHAARPRPLCSTLQPRGFCAYCSSLRIMQMRRNPIAQGNTKYADGTLNVCLFVLGSRHAGESPHIHSTHTRALTSSGERKF